MQPVWLPVHRLPPMPQGRGSRPSGRYLSSQTRSATARRLSRHQSPLLASDCEVRLRILWTTTELNAREIGLKLGLNRNAILGKITRLGLHNRDASKSQKGQ